MFANDLLQKVVDEDSSMKMRDTLDALRLVLDTMKQQSAAVEMTYPNAKAKPTSAASVLKACELPPIHTTVHVLKLTKSVYLSCEPVVADR